MAIVYKCKGCDSELYKFEKVGQDFYGVRTPSEISSIYGGKCPKCGKKLNPPSVDDVNLKLRDRKSGSF
ncbi:MULTISPECIES: hypothetical protein [Metallosphaera]|uniref:Uncharacterized protein n=3 Tax=Metallosphaera TaxID=41980 RepID=A4YHN5_METS5|nr:MULTISPECIES: hypothetical protein [Metallosphaera]ABP95937.1 hypothetical protein Msed_1782 [Metallosphaera sedula DSM 5348]AIM27921.1 hypothetical protein HA72_1782 [Metallosphaera sedula]AKV74755.1 hypothetical protein MsedA_1822 [Metallosphaera sedula]AKV76991.1 hypothetical protein MsedB_1824 [Metallosphaera sedula]AKV79243.1 hypothetical protein MsedC_1822 [Metallosphaera sedula]